MKKILVIAITAMIATGCYNDKYDQLYPLGATTCDTSTVGYAADIAPIFQSKCNNSGCHDATASGGYNLTTHAGTASATFKSRIVGSVSWTAGFSAMPKNTAKLSQCEIDKITRWVNQGAPNN